MRSSFDDFQTNLQQNIKYNNKLTNWQHLKLFAKRKIGTFKKITKSLPNPFVHPIIPPSLGNTPASSLSPSKSFNHKSKTPPTVFLTPPPTPRASPTKSFNHKSLPTPRNYPTKSLPTHRNYPTKSLPTHRNYHTKSLPTPKKYPTKSLPTPRNYPTKSFNHKSPPTNSNSPEKKNYKKSPVKAGAPYIIKY
jgi:hypothetical protein